MLPNSDGEMVEVSMKDLGIFYPVMVSNYRPVPVTLRPQCNATPRRRRDVRASIARRTIPRWRGFGGAGVPRRAATTTPSPEA